jgi:hypothetical protein
MNRACQRRTAVLLTPAARIIEAAWLAAHPKIEIVSRDRGGGFGEAAGKALPHTIQVADRWHLFENASAAFLDAVSKSMRLIRTVIGARNNDRTWGCLPASKGSSTTVISGARRSTLLLWR